MSPKHGRTALDFHPPRDGSSALSPWAGVRNFLAITHMSAVAVGSRNSHPAQNEDPRSLHGVR